jgi:hypothetical protein
MEEYKLYFKYPTWLFTSLIIGYSVMSITVISIVVLFLNNVNDFMSLTILERIVFLASDTILLLINILGWYIIIASGLQNKYYYIINRACSKTPK